ncbi:Tetratricopeptide repeat protein 6 [Mytilus edulis]|uniref:Tetratricopeptide repeat protein 6 n=1 Tax=Mytilus edulis TaxID=6550 RepID=A0A8S3UNG4_MYTED|nr:Tetratricopeptide repeat protein 6 [Mytilus edulis]
MTSSRSGLLKDLLEEARRISRSGDPLYKQRDKRGSMSQREKKDHKKDKRETEEPTPRRQERSVDEIISSLKANREKPELSEADKKIQEIMERVMSRTSAVITEDDSMTMGTDSARDESATSVKDVQSSGPTPQPPEVNVVSPTPDDTAGPKSPVADAETDKQEALTEDDESKSKDDGITSTDEKSEEKVKDETAQEQVSEIPPPAVTELTKMTTEYEDSSDDDEAEVIDIAKAWEDLAVPPNATYEDLVSVSGKPIGIQERSTGKAEINHINVQSQAVSFLSTWQPAVEREPTMEPILEVSTPPKHIHHFCTVTNEYQLPEQFRHLGRKYHAPEKFLVPKQPFRFASRGPSFNDALDEETASQLSHVAETRGTEDTRIASAAQRILKEAESDKDKSKEETLEIWRQRADEVFSQPSISVEGTKLSLKSDESRLYWTPAPPKLDVAPSKVKDILFPDYESKSLSMETRELSATQQEEMEDSSESEEEDMEVDIEQERYEEIYRLVFKKSDSYEDLSELEQASQQRDDDIKCRRINPYEPRKLLKGEIPPTKPEPLGHAQEADSKPSTPAPEFRYKRDMPDSEIFPVFVPLRRSRSDPCVFNADDDTLLVPQSYNIAVDEISRQKQNIRQMKLNWREEEKKAKREAEMEERLRRLEVPEGERYDPNEVMAVPSFMRRKADEPTPAELALVAGRAYVILPKKKKKKKKAPISMARLDEIEKFLAINSNQIDQNKIRYGPRKSLANILDFQAFEKKKKMPRDMKERDWVRDMWNGWFDELYPPTPEVSSDEEEEEEQAAMSPRKEEKQEKKRKESITSALSESISVIEPLQENEENQELLAILHEEVEKLTESIEASTRPKAFDLCRRGALLRKIGMVKKAEEDLNRVIKMEPELIDAYWHRHLLYLLQDKKKEALTDLNFIIKKNKKHAGAWRSRAEIYRQQNNVDEAIMNYRQAISLNPRDHEAYFRRAEMYEKKGDSQLLALEDYSKCIKINPMRTDAILKHGLYYFKNESWHNAITDFTDLLRVDPLNVTARIYRGQANAKMANWSPAVEDLSAAIHLDPLSWEAFYHRACIIRKAHPKRALHDYSVSLLINDTDDNVMSYLHRGILYNSMHRYEDAIPDFESVLKLRKDVACAHVNLGLIFMNHYENYHRAIKKFTAAIKVDPTYVRAYVCRGEAYHKIHELKQALSDFTKAIHLRPDGQLVLEMGNLELAAFCVRSQDVMIHASELSTDSSLGQMPTQQAVVQSFLKNYNKAIDALEAATRVQPVPSMFMLLGKTQMKAKEFLKAIESFNKALELYKPWKTGDPWPKEAAEAHFLIGMCNIELKTYIRALEAFSEAIRLNANYPDALYQRGVTRMKLNQLSKGIHDFNKALAKNPKIFQAYLSRACYYGMKKNYTKAILSCNEAIKLQPRSVRAYLYRGALKFHIKAYDLAIRDLTTATSIDSQCALAYFNRAVCYQEKKIGKRFVPVVETALTDYGIVLLLGADLQLKVLINRGLLYFERKDYINALYDFKLAAKIEPNDHRILHTLGLCYHKMNDLDEGVKVFTTCMDNNQFFLDGIIARGNVYMDYGTKAGIQFAKRDYERVLRQEPTNLSARVNLANTLQVLGKFMQAWNQFTIAISVRPTFKPALEGRAIVNLQMSNTFAAFQDINAAINVSPTAELLTNRGVINQFMQDPVNAMRDYQQALKLDKSYSLAYFNAANVYFHTRHFKQAYEYYSKALDHNRKDESALLNRAITRVMMRDAQGALEDFKAAIKLSPYTAHIYFNRGNLYASMGHFDKAETDYSKALSLKPDDPLVLKRRADVRGKLGNQKQAIQDYRYAIEIQSRMEESKT